MRKSILRFGALALMSMMSIGVWAQTFVVDENVYEVSDQDKQTVALVSASRDMPLGGKVTYNEVEYKITKINAYAYLNTTVEGGVTIPGTVTVVGASALKGQTINNTEFPAFTSIGEAAFYGATFSKPNAMFAIGCNLPKGAFHNATFGAGTRIKLSNPNLTSLEDEVFCLDALKASDGLVYVELPFACVGSFNKVGKSAFKNRDQLIGFGYNSASTYYLLPLALESVDEYAFAGCKDLNLYFDVNGEYDGIRNVGKYAFSGCKKLDNAMFANICKSFEGLSFAEGSFKDCSLTSVDLSKWTTIDALALDLNKIPTPNDPSDDTSFKGIPAFAFSGNPITTLKYPKELQAIGTKAFEGNRLETISLPEGLLYVGEYALMSANETEDPAAKFTQADLYLPKSLKQIFAGGIDNREITNIYAWPTLKEGEVTYIPTIGAHTALEAALTIPVIAPYKTTGDNPTTVTSKTLYSDAGWKSENLATNFSVQYPVYRGASRIQYSNVIYDVKYDGGKLVIDEDYGYYTANVGQLEGDSEESTFHGFFEATSPNDKTTFGNYTYNVVFKARFSSGITVANNTDHAITIEPNSGNTDLATGFAQFFKNDQTFTKYTLPENAFKEDANLTSVTFGTGITAIPDKAFYGCTKLSAVNFDTDSEAKGIQSDITSIGEYAFAGTKKLESIDLPSGLASVGEDAFSDLAAEGTEGQSNYVEPRPAGLTSVTLPNTLAEIGASAFAAKSIEKVYVSYALVPELSANPFAYVSDEDQDHYKADLIVTNGKYARSAYLDVDCWQKFFKNGGDYSTTTFTEVVAAPTQTEPNATANKTVCADENGVFVFDDDVKAVQITGIIGAEAVSGTPGTPAVTVPVKYNRTFGNTSWQAISLPFDVPVEKIPKGLEVAELYNIRLDGETGALEAVVWVKLQKGVMNAFTPYVIRANETGAKTIELDAVIKKNYTAPSGTETTGTYETGTVDCSSTKEKYTLYSNFGETDMFDTKGYYLGSGVFNWSGETGPTILKPYRFYMTRILRSAGETTPTYLYGKFEDPTPYPTTGGATNVKVVVLDDEEEAATYINSLNVRDAENLSAPMYDITGRQIVSPVKGQVYIQNGVKKLAK